MRAATLPARRETEVRQVFSSARLENVESVAELLRGAGIEVRITGGRSYKGAMRSRPSYSAPEETKSAVWVVKSDDQVRAREILREHGLLESTRPGSFAPLSFRDEDARAAAKTPQQRRAFRFKLFLLAIIAVVIVLSMLRGCYTPRVAEPAGPPPVSDRPLRAGGTPESLALVVFARELANQKMVVCLGIDGADASAAVIAAMQMPTQTVVPASQCVRDFDPERGSYQAVTGKPALIATVHGFKQTAPGVATVEIETFHHGQFAHYKTLEVRRNQGAWQVSRVLRHVASYGLGE